MTKKLKPAKQADEIAIQRALLDLRTIRDQLKTAGALQAVIAVRHAIKSTEGALRHVGRRLDAQEAADRRARDMMKDFGGKVSALLAAADFATIVESKIDWEAVLKGKTVDIDPTEPAPPELITGEIGRVDDHINIIERPAGEGPPHVYEDQYGNERWSDTNEKVGERRGGW